MWSIVYRKFRLLFSRVTVSTGREAMNRVAVGEFSPLLRVCRSLRRPVGTDTDLL